MSISPSRVAGVGLLFVLIFLSGFWLSQSGKPYGVILLAIHKLIAVAAFALLVTIVYQTNRVAKLSALEFSAGVVTGVFFLGTILSGGLLSMDRPMPAALLTMHQVTPFLTVFSAAATLYLLFHRTGVPT